VLLLDREPRRDQATQRESGQVDVGRQSELVEQLDVVQDQVVYVLQPLKVARIAVAGMVGDEHAVTIGPPLRECPAVPRARAVHEHQRR
jgi:hypothetical protein